MVAQSLKQAFSQDFESGRPKFLWACGAMLLGGSGGMPPLPENVEKLKPLRRDFRDSEQL